MYNKSFVYSVLLLMLACKMSAQEYNGLTGLLAVPCADTDSAATFRGGAMFLHQDFIPSQLPRKNTYGYVVGISGFRWLQLSYAGTLLWMHKNGNKQNKMGFYNEDRRVNVKVTPLYEGRWWPAVALGWDDIGRWDRMRSGKNRNNYYQNLYAAGSKHFNVKGYDLGVHFVYRYFPSEANKDRRGVAGGMTLHPAFCRPLRMVAEWDGVGLNAGADVLLWSHLFVQATLVHGHGFTGGVSYRYIFKY